MDPVEFRISSGCIEYFGFLMLFGWGEILSSPLIGMDFFDFARFISGCIDYNLFSSSMEFLDFACFISGCIEGEGNYHGVEISSGDFVFLFFCG